MTAESVAQVHAESLAGLVAGAARSGTEVDAQEVVWAPKSQVGRYRPLTAISFDHRVLLRALVADIAVELEPVDRSDEGQADLTRPGRLNDEPRYVVVADIASFYQYVDHELLEVRAVETTGRADTAEALRLVLTHLEGRPYGIPQNYDPSTVLSELVVAPVERRLLRAGVPTYRMNDDFRMSADT